MVNRTDVALKMLNVTAYPSFGFQIKNKLEPATSLWESYDAPSMHQWVDESSRDHHYSASINTFMRKYLAGLDQPLGSAGFGGSFPGTGVHDDFHDEGQIVVVGDIVIDVLVVDADK